MCTSNKPHPHAELMAQYAEDAKETDRPWERWIFLSKYGWLELGDHPTWNEGTQFKRKPRTININGYEVPEPVRSKPESGAEVFMVNLNNSQPVTVTFFIADVDTPALKHGLLHTTREAAELHAKALLSFTNSKG